MCGDNASRIQVREVCQSSHGFVQAPSQITTILRLNNRIGKAALYILALIRVVEGLQVMASPALASHSLNIALSETDTEVEIAYRALYKKCMDPD